MTTDASGRGPEIEKQTHPAVILAVIGVGTFLSAMANSTVSLALPSISAELHVQLSSVSWIMMSYLLTTAVLLMPAGRAGDLWTHRTTYLVGFLIFFVGSLGTGLADALWLLVAGRIVQGIGGSLLLAAGPALLTTSFPAAKRGQALGMVSTATYVGLTLGPPLGGWLIALGGWRWVFFLNLPISLFLLVLGWRFLPRLRLDRKRPFDLAGTAALLFGLPFALLALVEGDKWGWTSPWIIGSGLLGLAVLTVFVLIERRHATPVLDFSLFKSRIFSGAVLSALGNYISLFIPLILLPFCLTEGLGGSTATAGMLLMAQPAMMALSATPAGWFSDRIGPRPLAMGGLLVLSVGLLGLSTIGADTPHWAAAVWMGIVGLGTGIFVSPNSSALMGSAPRDRQGVASGVMALARTLGMTIGIALATAIFEAAGGTTGHPWTTVDFLAQRHAFWVAAAVSFASVIVAGWGNRKKA